MKTKKLLATMIMIGSLSLVACNKITTPDDYYTMRALLEAKENAQIYGF